MEAARKLAPERDLTVLTRKQAQNFHKLLEEITNFSISNVKNEKGFYNIC